MVRRIVNLLIAWRLPLLFVGLAVSVAACFRAQHLSFDRAIENMFAADDPILAPFRQLERTFGGDEIALAAYPDPQLLTPRGLDRLDRLTDELGRVRGVDSVFSLTKSPLVGKSIAASPFREAILQLSEGYTIGADR